MRTVKIVRRQIPAHQKLHDQHPLLQRVYANRGITCPTQLQHQLSRLAAPQLLSNINQAAEHIAAAITQQHAILIVGDYDADGATGVAVAVRGLRMLGATHVDFLVPNRFVHGYGLTPELVAEINTPPPQLLITVDNGIASVAGVHAARERGIQVIITDHHLPGATLPDADVIVNPNSVGDSFPSKALAGVGVMFYVLLAVRQCMREQGLFSNTNTEPDLSALLDLVAVGTVADLVPLDFNNRILVQAGLRRIRQRKACPGIMALIEVSGRNAAQITTSDLGFAIAPRINAAGRLEDMRVGIHCLLATDMAQAKTYAELLHGINDERRALQNTMVQEAEHLVSSSDTTYQSRAGVCLFDPAWHSGVVGLVASRLKEQLHRPVIAFTCAPEESGVLRGSARSVAGLHIRDVIATIATQYPDSVIRFGGHAMAAGLSIPAAQLEIFSHAFDEIVRQQLGDAVGCAEIITDGALAHHEINIENAEILRDAAPWGQNFPEPVFDDVFIVENCQIVGAQHVRMQLRLPDHSLACHAIYFNGLSAGLPSGRIHVVYQMHVDEWQMRKKVTLLVRHWDVVL